MSRMDKVNQQVKREIGHIIQQELSDPRLQFVTIMRADVSADLRNAKIFFSVLGDAQKAESALQGLNAAKGSIRRLISKNINLRYTPDIAFYFDQTIVLNEKVEEALRNIHGETDPDNSDDQIA